MGDVTLEQLEDLPNIEREWLNERTMKRDRVHREDFPVLPEVPIARYIDPAFFEFEKAHMWRKTWILVAFANELPDVGSFKTLDVLDSPILLVRSQDNGIRAFHNVCQHRGAKLCYAGEGTARRFQCTYHNWVYDLDGNLIHITDDHEFPGVHKKDKPLSPLRCEMLGNFIFISFAPEGPTLAEHLGKLPPLMTDIPFDRLELHKTVSWHLNCNWKCAHENFLETLHIPFVHPGTVHKTIDNRCFAKYVFSKGHSVTNIKARVGFEAGLYRKDVDSERTMKPITYQSTRTFNIFPNIVMPISDGVFAIIEAMPLTVSTCRIDVHFLVKDLRASGAAADAMANDAIAAFGPVVEEDVIILAEMHRSLAGGGIRSVPLSYSEQLIYNYQIELDRLMDETAPVPAAWRLKRIPLPWVDI